jgi:ubiquitin fusion degradation protein 1
MIVSNDTLQNEVRVPGPLNLPPGRLFFGFRHIPYKPPSAPSQDTSESDHHKQAQAFSGEGSSLTDFRPSTRNTTSKASTSTSSQEQSKEPHKWGNGSSLGNTSRKQPFVRRSPTPDYGVDSDVDVIEIDSD